jgi:curli production assembly/transport component CsgF
MKKIIAICGLILAQGANASELTFQFASPSFSGIGFSSHVLTIKQLEDSRKQKLRDEAKSVTDRAERDAKNTTLSKFIVNLESRIYAQLSKQLADAMFSETAGDSGTLDFQGSSISWFKTGTSVTLVILEANGSRTEITVPIGSFAF